MKSNIFKVNKHSFFLFCFFLLFTTFFSTEIFAQEEEDTADIPKRAEWFIKQRQFPNDTIPIYGYVNALLQRNQIRNQNVSMINLPWVSIGPTPELSGNNVWTGKCNFIKYDPTEQNIVYLGAAEGGVWKSTNSGTSWNSITPNNFFGTSGAFAIDASQNPHVLYYGTGEDVFDCWYYYGDGLYKSTDEGTTWTHISSGLPSLTYFYAIAIDPANNLHLLAAIATQDPTLSGLYQSNDGGLSWSILISNRTCTDCTFAPYPSTNAYVVGFMPTSSNGYLLSTNSGYNFFDPGLSALCDARTRLTVCEGNSANSNYLYIITSHTTGNTSFSLYKSTDWGQSFAYLPNNSGIPYDFWEQYSLNIKVSPVNPLLVFIIKTWLWRSNDGGNSFGEVALDSHGDFHSLDFDPYDNQNTVMFVDDGGAHRSTNLGTNSNGSNSGLGIKQVYRINSDPYNPEVVLGGAQDNGYWRKNNPNSNQWTGSDNGDWGTVRFSKVTPNTTMHIHCNNGSSEEYSIDDGVSWSSCSLLPINSVSWLTPINSDQVSANTFYTARYRVFKTTNIGTNWTFPSSDLSYGDPIDVVNINSKDPNIMWAVPQNAWNLHVYLYKSTDNGSSWNNTHANDPGSNKIPHRFVSSIASDPANSDETIVGLSGFSDASNPGNIFRSQDGGNNWYSIS